MGESTATATTISFGRLASSASSVVSSVASTPCLSHAIQQRLIEVDPTTTFLGFETTPSLLKHSVVAATICLFLYDYICTLDREVKFVWSRPRSLGTYLFFLNRYLPFCDLTVALYTVLSYNSPAACHFQYSAIIWLNTIGITVAQTILSLRTLAMWERNVWVLCILITVYFGTLIPSVVTIQIFIRTLKFVNTGNGRCTLPSASKIIVLSYILIMISETTIVILTLIRAIKHLRYSDSTWVHQLYKRGFIFYFSILGVTTLNLVYPFFAIPPMRSLFTDLQRVMHSMLCNRVVFLILSRQRQDEIDCCDTTDDTRSRTARGGRATDGALVMTSMLDTYITHEDVYARSFQREHPD